MKLILRILLLLVVVMLLGMGWTMLPLRLTVTEVALPTSLPPATPPAGMSLSVLPTGKMIADEMSAYRGGSPLKKYESGMAAALVRHPHGDLLIDTGFGRAIEQHLKGLPWLMKAMSSAEPGRPAFDQLVRAGYAPIRLDGIVLTHAHWDHVSGLPDFPHTPVWVTAAERDFIAQGGESAALAHSMTGVRYQTYGFSETPYMGFARSKDVHGDGSLVIVPLPGHTPGSVGLFVNLPSGKRYFFIGDLVWMIEGIERPAERPFLARRMVDHDAAGVRAAINHVHQIHKAFPEIVIVPAHDARVHRRLNVFPDSEG